MAKATDAGDTPSASNTPDDATIQNQAGVTPSVDSSRPADAAEAVGTDTAAPVRPPIAEIKGIRYTDTSDVRILEVADLQRLGIDEPKGRLEWNRENGKIIPIEDVNAATLDALLALGEFEIVPA